MYTRSKFLSELKNDFIVILIIAMFVVANLEAVLDLRTSFAVETSPLILFGGLEGARASTGLSLLCVNVGYKHWSNDSNSNMQPIKGVDPDTKVGGTAYMSTQREVLEGQTGSHRAKRANFGRGVNFKNLHGKWCNLRYS